MSEPQPPEHNIEAHDREPHRDGAATHPEYRPRPNDALARIHERVKGQGDPDEVPQLVSMLTNVDRKALAADFYTFSTLPGDAILRSASELPVSSTLAVKVALSSHANPSPSAVAGYLEGLGKLRELDEQTVATLRTTLPGSPLLLFQTLIANLAELEANPAMLRWVVEATPPALCAHVIGQALSSRMATTLDNFKLWQPWIDHLRPPDIGNYTTSAIITIHDPHARAVFTTAASGRAGLESNPNLDDRAKPENRHALDLALDDKGATIESILAAAGQAMDIDQKSFGKLVATLDRLHASADDVISISQVSGIHVEDMLELLLRSRGVTATHVQLFLAEHGGFELLQRDKPRMAVQRMAGMPSLLQLMGSTRDSSVHAVIIGSPPLFTWFMKGDVAPEDLLWLCASNPQLAARATRLVEAHVGFTWVHQLLTLATGKDGLLRTFALYCHDEPTASYVREHLLGDPPFNDKVVNKGSQSTDPATHSGQGGRFVDSLSDYGSPAEIVARLGDLDQPVRFGLGRDDAAVAPIAKELTGDLYARAARMLDLTFERTIRHSPAPSSATLAYLASRPHAEQLAALRTADFALVARTVHSNLLLVFPSLTDPKVLAGLVGRAPLLALLLEGSDPGRIAALIGADPVRAAAQPVLDQHPELLGRLPHYKELDPAAQHGVDELAKHSDPDADDVRESLDHDSKQPGVEHQAKRLRDVRKAKTLFEAIETLGTQHAKGEHRINDKHDPDARAAHEREHHVSETNALAILEQYRTDVPALLNEPSHRPSVMKLATLLDVPPNVAIPWLDAAALARMPNAVAWWMAFRDPLALLHQLANNPQAIAVVAEAINTNTMGALHWLERMPKGFELDSLEDRVIEQLRTRLHANSEGVRALFRVRFGMPAPADYDVKLTNQLWDVIGRLPPDQLKQERISKFDVVPKEDMDAAGQYSPGDQRIDIAKGLEKNTDKDTFYSAAHEAWYSRAELQKAFGYSDAAFDQLASQGRFEVRVATLGPTPTTQYRMKEQTHDLFTQVVLHEVGHSVDDMLGSRTPPVWDYAGWHEYSNANFDQWAAEMGGWDEVSATDQKSIREAWISALGGKVAVSTLVDSEHPAVNTTKYKRVGIVTVGAAGKRLGFADRTQIGDRIFIAGTVEEAFFSVKASAAAVAPSDYALNAPAE